MTRKPPEKRAAVAGGGAFALLDVPRGYTRGATSSTRGICVKPVSGGGGNLGEARSICAWVVAGRAGAASPTRCFLVAFRGISVDSLRARRVVERGAFVGDAGSDVPVALNSGSVERTGTALFLDVFRPDVPRLRAVWPLGPPAGSWGSVAFPLPLSFRTVLDDVPGVGTVGAVGPPSGATVEERVTTMLCDNKAKLV